MANEPTTAETVSSTPDDGETALLLKYLETHDAVCPLCRYNLRNLTVPRCPECGRGIKLTVGMVEPYLLPWILMTVALAMAAGIGLLFLMLCIVLGSPHIGFNNLRTLGIWTPIIWTLAAIPLTSVLILRRHVFLRQERSRQWVWATTVLGITTGLLALFLVSISR